MLRHQLYLNCVLGIKHALSSSNFICVIAIISYIYIHKLYLFIITNFFVYMTTFHHHMLHKYCDTSDNLYMAMS